MADDHKWYRPELRDGDTTTPPVNHGTGTVEDAGGNPTAGIDLPAGQTDGAASVTNPHPVPGPLSANQHAAGEEIETRVDLESSESTTVAMTSVPHASGELPTALDQPVSDQGPEIGEEASRRRLVWPFVAAAVAVVAAAGLAAIPFS
jgi:hypothetical protein